MGQQRPDLAGRTWDPQYPDAAVGDGGTYHTPTDPDKPQVGKPYTIAPATSHLHGFRLFDDSFTQKFVAESQGFPRGWSLIQVAFRPKAGGKPAAGIEAEYYYGFPTADEARGWFAQLEAAAEPGKVIWAMQRAGVKYRKRSG